jgi:phosphorylcholine metabolism protein LicD
MIFDKFMKDDVENNISMDNYVSKKEFNKLKRSINAQQNYLNLIYSFYELEPKPFLEKFRNLSFELIAFLDNVCLKYDLEYWLDCETLLGAVMHGDLIPWDDHLNVGMVNSDYMKLKEVLQSEIDNNNLKNIDCSYASKNSFQVNYTISGFEDNLIGINIVSYPAGDIEEDEIIFPLKKIRFGKYDLSYPNNSDEYLKRIYGKKYIKIPIKVHDYGRLNDCLKQPNIIEVLDESNAMFRKANENFR